MFDRDSPNGRYERRLPPSSENLAELSEWYNSQLDSELRDELDKHMDKKGRILRESPDLASGSYGPGHPQEFNLKNCDIHIRLIEEALESNARSRQSPSVTTDNPRRGYRAEVRKWMKDNELKSIPEAAERLGVGFDILKSIMSAKGTKRYGDETLRDVLKKIGYTTP